MFVCCYIILLFFARKEERDTEQGKAGQEKVRNNRIRRPTRQAGFRSLSSFGSLRRRNLEFSTKNVDEYKKTVVGVPALSLVELLPRITRHYSTSILP